MTLTPGADHTVAAEHHNSSKGAAVTSTDIIPVPNKAGSARALSPAARTVHRWVLTAFAETGRVPSRADLERHTAASGADHRAVVAELVDRDVLAVDERGEIRAAYPFSPVPTRHRVTWDGGTTVYAMCAIDALGISAMLDVPVTVTGTEPGTGHTVTVHVDRDTAHWEPGTAVVFAGQAGDARCPSVDRTCGHVNFFTGPDAARDWAAATHGVTGVVLDQEQALAEGIAGFGGLLREDRAAIDAAEDFRERGFTHVPQLLTAGEVARFRAAAEEALAAASHTDEEFGTRIVATTDAWEHHPVLRELALHPRLGALAEQLAGMPLRVWGGEVLRKDTAHSAPTGWHDDLTFALLDSRLIFNAWIALVDVPAERGCLTFLPGSHRRGGPDRAELAEHTADPDGYLFRRWPELRWSPRVTVPLRAGDATFHQGRTAHYAGANTTDEARLSFLVTFTDADATYRPLPGRDPLGLRPGQALPDHRYPRAPQRNGG
ncbi:hypothetical protein EWH70_06445 [Amycolatopsis suaedae]|uniref:Phytanoyl-CoA dioxygenase family protein n=1 Tax=Amycolatopsis suaedae TaxID=2510978 RepID=A0A4Q7J9V5_9PSEU|nr:hypothetical protein EWH70_06445 [Amycolatopsis suaedae]